MKLMDMAAVMAKKEVHTVMEAAARISLVYCSVIEHYRKIPETIVLILKAMEGTSSFLRSSNSLMILRISMD